MTDLPRSRALVQLDGPGHILPIEPVTPEGSTAWRIVHLPLVLVLVALGLFALAGIATGMLSHGFAQVSAFPGARLVATALSAALVLAIYWVFVRLVERRRDIVELGGDGWLVASGIAYASGLLLTGAIFALLLVLGGLGIGIVTAPRDIVWLSVSSLSSAVIQEIILRGLFFRLVERLLGSWIALAASAALLWIGYAVMGGGSALAALGFVLKTGLLLAALYMVTRRLWAAVGLHAACSLAQIVLLGMTIPGAALGKPDWLTGGRFGPDAALPAIFVYAAVVVALLAVAVRRGRIVRPIWRQRRR